MDAFNTRRIINETRLTTRNSGISTAELNFVLNTSLIKTEAKLTWLHIAAKSASHPAFCCKLSEKEILPLVADQPNAVFNTLENLKKQHFLNIYDPEGLGSFYYLSLPEDGINALMDAPKLCSCLLKKER